jgi:hypothetical protein
MKVSKVSEPSKVSDESGVSDGSILSVASGVINVEYKLAIFEKLLVGRGGLLIDSEMRTGRKCCQPSRLDSSTIGPMDGRS